MPSHELFPSSRKLPASRNSASESHNARSSSADRTSTVREYPGSPRNDRPPRWSYTAIEMRIRPGTRRRIMVSAAACCAAPRTLARRPVEDGAGGPGCSRLAFVTGFLPQRLKHVVEVAALALPGRHRPTRRGLVLERFTAARAEGRGRRTRERQRGRPGHGRDPCHESPPRVNY